MSDSRDLRKRLDALNRAPLPEPRDPEPDVEGVRRKLREAARDRQPAGPEPIVYRRDMPRSEPTADRPRVRDGQHVVLEDAVDGLEVGAPGGGKAYVISETVAGLQDVGQAVCQAFRDGMRQAGSGLRRRLASVCGAAGLGLGDVTFMDLETTGLAGTPVFLIGTMRWEAGGLVVRQYLARDYSEERAIISLSLDRLAAGKLLVTFNGKSFDVPYIRVRSAANRIRFVMDLPHLDLLHECRRAWRHLLPDCRLQTLESRICGRPRYADIPSHEIPEAYHAFVRTGNAVEIVDILKHNVLDLVTLAELMVKLPGPG